MKLHTRHFSTDGDCWRNNFFLRQLWTLAERDFVWISSFNWIKVRIMNCSISKSCRAGVTEPLEMLEQVSTLICAILEPFDLPVRWIWIPNLLTYKFVSPIFFQTEKKESLVGRKEAVLNRGSCIYFWDFLFT